MKISLIISAHKESPYLIEAIESSINQTFPKEDYEIILSSDGCDLKELATKYGIKYCLTPKSNHSTALNKAVKKAKGEWIKDLHYDDVLLPNCLEDLWNGKGGSLVYANAINFFENGREQLYKPPKKVTLAEVWPPVKCPVHAATIMWRRDDFLAIGGRDVTMETSEEYEYYIRLLTKGFELVYTDKTVVRYRRHDEQKTASYDQDKRLAVKNYILEKFK